MQQVLRKRRYSGRRPSRGIALLLVLVVMLLTSVIVSGIGGGLTTQFAAYRNTSDYDQAQYLAGAGVHHAIALLEENSAWRGTLDPIELPTGSGRYYSVTVADGDAGDVVIVAEGAAGTVTRRIQTVITFNG